MLFWFERIKLMKGDFSSKFINHLNEVKYLDSVLRASYLSSTKSASSMTKKEDFHSTVSLELSCSSPISLELTLR